MRGLVPGKRGVLHQLMHQHEDLVGVQDGFFTGKLDAVVLFPEGAELVNGVGRQMAHQPIMSRRCVPANAVARARKEP